jgi:general stress protein CsbA
MTLNEIVKANLPNNKKEWVWFIIIILLVVAVGVFTFNQYLAIQYKARLILNPCSLCDTYQQQVKMQGIDLGNLTFNNKLIG